MEKPVDIAIPEHEVWQAIGQKLRAARLERKIATSDIAEYLKISVRKVDAIEEAHLDQLPAIAFTKGFVRSYAKLLQLDLNDLLAQISTQISIDPHKNNRVYKRKVVRAHHNGSSTRFLRKWLLALALVVLVVLSFMALKFFTLTGTAAQKADAVVAEPPVTQATASATEVSTVASPASTTDKAGSTIVQVDAGKTVATTPVVPTKSAPTSATPTPSVLANTESSPARATLIVAIEGDTWLQVLSKNGKIVFDHSYKSGQKEEITITLPAQVIVGDVKSVRLQYKGKKLPLASNHGVGFVEIKE